MRVAAHRRAGTPTPGEARGTGESSDAERAERAWVRKRSGMRGLWWRRNWEAGRAEIEREESARRSRDEARASRE